MGWAHCEVKVPHENKVPGGCLAADIAVGAAADISTADLAAGPSAGLSGEFCLGHGHGLPWDTMSSTTAMPAETSRGTCSGGVMADDNSRALARDISQRGAEACRGICRGPPLQSRKICIGALVGSDRRRIRDLDPHTTHGHAVVVDQPTDAHLRRSARDGRGQSPSPLHVVGIVGPSQLSS